MDCPRCREKMDASNSSGIATTTCLYCNGTWVGGKSFEKLLNKEKTPTDNRILWDALRYRAKEGAKRICPECHDQFLDVMHVHGVEIDICSKCSGVFFDEGELIKILPTIQHYENTPSVGGYIATEGLFWILVGLFSGSRC